MQTNLFYNENPEESIEYRIKRAAINIQLAQLHERELICYARPIARERAIIFRKMGTLCKSINKYTVKLLL